MSLAEAVISVADDMEKVSTDTNISEIVLKAMLRSYARELRTAVKAAGGSQPPVSLSAPHDHQKMIDECRKEFRKDREESSPAMAEVVDGPYAFSMVAIDSSMPVGAKTMLDGTTVYVLKADGKLYQSKSS